MTRGDIEVSELVWSILKLLIFLQVELRMDLRWKFGLHFETGRGRVVIEENEFEETSTRDQIIVEEIPYMINKSTMIKQTADLINSKKLDGIADIRDESDRNGMRIVYDLKKDAIPNMVLNKLFKFTSLQSSFSVNNIALVKAEDISY